MISQISFCRVDRFCLLISKIKVRCSIWRRDHRRCKDHPGKAILNACLGFCVIGAGGEASRAARNTAGVNGELQNNFYLAEDESEHLESFIQVKNKSFLSSTSREQNSTSNDCCAAWEHLALRHTLPASARLGVAKAFPEPQTYR